MSGFEPFDPTEPQVEAPDELVAEEAIQAPAPSLNPLLPPASAGQSSQPK